MNLPNTSPESGQEPVLTHFAYWATGPVPNCRLMPCGLLGRIAHSRMPNGAKTARKEFTLVVCFMDAHPRASTHPFRASEMLRLIVHPPHPFDRKGKFARTFFFLLFVRDSAPYPNELGLSDWLMLVSMHSGKAPLKNPGLYVSIS